MAAALSFRYEACLRPFPPGFLKNNIKDMDELVIKIKLPTFTILLTLPLKYLILTTLFFTTHTYFLLQLSVISEVPALDLLLQKLDNLDNLSHISHILDLLFYVLVRLKEPTLKSIPPEAVKF